VKYATENYNTLTYNFTGFSLGLGYKQIFRDGWYGFAEANYADYGSQTESATNPVAPGRNLTASGTNGLSTVNVLVGVGYKF
jgi:opacity protein-like surface antigen